MAGAVHPVCPITPTALKLMWARTATLSTVTSQQLLRKMARSTQTTSMVPARPDWARQQVSKRRADVRGGATLLFVRCVGATSYRPRLARRPPQAAGASVAIRHHDTVVQPNRIIEGRGRPRAQHRIRRTGRRGGVGLVSKAIGLGHGLGPFRLRPARYRQPAASSTFAVACQGL
jgi:hypothetical protein